MRVPVLLALASAARLAAASIYVADFANCLGDYDHIAPSDMQLKARHVYAEIVPSKDTVTRGFSDDHDTLRLDVIGSIASELNGYNETNNRVGEFPRRSELESAGGVNVTTELFPETLN